MRLYSYIVVRDFGFAPNPFYGFCTLATCKPKIRASASAGDWIIGTGAKSTYNMAGRLMYAMQVNEVLDFDTYWNDPRFMAKRPDLRGSLKVMYGDNIYHRIRGRWLQADSHHSLENGRSNKANIAWDTGVNRVMVATKFVYWGTSAPDIPNRFRPFRKIGRDICCKARGHCVFGDELATAFVAWLEEQAKWGVQDEPVEFAKHNRVARGVNNSTTTLAQRIESGVHTRENAAPVSPGSGGRRGGRR